MSAPVEEVVAILLGEGAPGAENGGVVVEVTAAVGPGVGGEHLGPGGAPAGRAMQRSLIRASWGSRVTNPASAQCLVKGGAGRAASGWRRGRWATASLQPSGEGAEEGVLEAEAGDPVAEPIQLSDEAAVVGLPSPAGNGAAVVLTSLAAAASLRGIEGVAPAATRGSRGKGGRGTRLDRERTRGCR